jgi:hypothetical protein
MTMIEDIILSKMIKTILFKVLVKSQCDVTYWKNLVSHYNTYECFDRDEFTKRIR